MQCNGMKLGLRNMTCAFQQVSILGYKLFLLYINDICHVSIMLDFIPYTDDSNISCKH